MNAVTSLNLNHVRLMEPYAIFFSLPAVQKMGTKEKGIGMVPWDEHGTGKIFKLSFRQFGMMVSYITMEWLQRHTGTECYWGNSLQILG